MNRLKECSPYDTVMRIRHILEDLNIFIVESWCDSKISSLFSVRINIVGTHVGTNGKGVNRILALASAYGEFMERLSTGMLLQKLGIDISHFYSDGCNLHFKEITKGGYLTDAILFSMQEGNKDCAMHLKYASELNLYPQERINRLSMWGIQQNKEIFCLPYTGLHSGKKEFLPLPLVQHYGSNGMAAGNSTQEAIVQAISEIFERWSVYYIFINRLTPPIISRDVIRNYFPNIDLIMSEIESTVNLKVEIRDCSLGKGFPVYCACLYDRRSHQYAVSFGSSPNIETCLERLFTELVQGRKIDETALGKVDADLLVEPFELRRLFRNSAGNYPQEFLIGKPSWDVEESLLEQQCTTNDDALKLLSSLCKNFSKDIFVRDYSVFNFPCVHVIIPGLSEVMGSSPFFLHYLSSLRFSNKIINNITSISKDQLSFLLEFLDFCRKMNAEDMMPFTKIHGLQGMQFNEGILFFLARGYAQLKDFNRASEFCIKLKELSPTYSEALSCLATQYKLYAIDLHCKAKEMLEKIYNSDIIELAQRMDMIPIKNLFNLEKETPDVKINEKRLSTIVKNYIPNIEHIRIE